MVEPRRLNSHQRRERQKRKQFEKERPELGGFVWQAILISLLGCLFCAGKDFEEKIENAKVSIPKDTEGGEDSGGRQHQHHHHRSTRGRSRRSRSISDQSSEGAYRDRNGGGGIINESGYDGVEYISADHERYRTNDDRLRRYVESQSVYEVEESPAPRRRRVKRGDVYD